jgi:hypothetical protein
MPTCWQSWLIQHSRKLPRPESIVWRAHTAALVSLQAIEPARRSENPGASGWRCRTDLAGLPDRIAKLWKIPDSGPDGHKNSGTMYSDTVRV